MLAPLYGLIPVIALWLSVIAVTGREVDLVTAAIASFIGAVAAFTGFITGAVLGGSGLLALLGGLAGAAFMLFMVVQLAFDLKASQTSRVLGLNVGAWIVLLALVRAIQTV